MPSNMRKIRRFRSSAHAKSSIRSFALPTCILYYVMLADTEDPDQTGGSHDELDLSCTQMPEGTFLHGPFDVTDIWPIFQKKNYLKFI